MIDFLKIKNSKAYAEIMEIAEQPGVLFSNDPLQMEAEALYNMRTIQRLNKLIKRDSVSLHELDNLFAFLEDAWASYLQKFYAGKTFVFYLWGDYQIPAIRFSVISYEEGLRLPFACKVNQASDRKEVLLAYREKACFDGLQILQHEEDSGTTNEEEEETAYTATVYTRIIEC
ncbi:hypothetical protein [Paenibacillus chitinolyticus]|uniref:hypothetical protein n=1 Tax=Paenibacillus chitinolyticus TaxID=79263 RepID=UPI00366E0E15